MCAPHGGCEVPESWISRTISEDEVRRIAREEIQKFLAGKTLTNGEAL